MIMKTTVLLNSLLGDLSNLQAGELVDYYEKAGPDYEFWSPNFNMHFGYYKRGINPFRRESMLQEMNRFVLDNLDIDQSSTSTLVDLGCGLGATMRFAIEHYPNLSCEGVTIVPWQKKNADLMNTNLGCSEKITVHLENYNRTHFPDNSIDHVIAVESSCYASGSNKESLLHEIKRILKPGGSFVIADGFIKSDKPLRGYLKRCYDQLCESWVLDELGNIEHVQSSLLESGFKNIKAVDISWKVAPSVAHVPITVLHFLLVQLVNGAKMNKERWNNLKSPLLTLIVGLHRKYFGYYLIKGRKDNE